MGLQRFSKYLLMHRWQTIALTFAITFIPVIGIFGILIAAFVTLAKNITEGIYLTLAATLPYLISFYFTKTSEPSISFMLWAAVGVAVFSNLLTLILAIMLRQKTSWSVLLQLTALFGVLVVSVIHLIYPDIATWWGTAIKSYYDQMQATAGLVKTAALPAGNEAQGETIAITKQYATGLMVTAILFNAVAQLIVARWWQCIVFSKGSLQKELHRIRLNRLTGFLFLISLFFSYLGNRVVLDIMPILYALFGVAGLSLVHYWFGHMKSQTAWIWLVLLYVVLIISFPMSVALIALLALADVWLDIRKRVKFI